MKKKQFALILMLVSVVSAFAQRPFMRDTIRHREPTYYYQFWLDSANIKYLSTTDSCKTVLDSGSISYELAKYNYTDSALKVVGVAAAVFSKKMEPWAVVDSTYDNWFEYMRLYKHTDTGMVVLAEKTYTVLDTSRWMMAYNPTKTGVVGHALPIFEVFFDQPIEVTDSFYVSVTDYHAYTNPWTGLSPGNWAVPYFYYTWLSIQNGSTLTHCFGQPCMYVSRYDSLWHNCVDDCVFFIFPIIDTTQPLPDTCYAPTSLTAMAQDSASELLGWTRGRYNHSWQAAFGPADSSAAWTLVDAADTSILLTGLVPRQEYAACVRAVCADTTRYSEWSDTIRFTAGRTAVIASTAQPPAFVLAPNPASGAVTVTVGKEALLPAELTVSDASGKEVLRRTLCDRACRLDALPAGIYFVTLVTKQGAGTQKLVVKG